MRASPSSLGRVVELAEPTVRLRERQRRDTEATIRGAALQLAVEHGVSAVTVHDISRAAGVSPRTFFNHFRSKEEALVPALPPFPAEVEQAFVRAEVTDLWDALATLMADHVAYGFNGPAEVVDPAAPMRLVEANPALLPRLLAVFDDFDHRVADLVARRTGRDPEELFCTVAATVATSTVRAGLDAQRRNESAPGPPDPEAIRAAFAILRGLVQPGGTSATATA